MKTKEQIFSPETPLGKFEAAVRVSWSFETAYPGDASSWTPENPALGQCVVTMLVLADYFPGGSFLKSTEHHHYAYKLGEQLIDLTGEQFGPEAEIVFDTTSDRERLMNSTGAVVAWTPERYALLRGRVEKILGAPGGMVVGKGPAGSDPVGDLVVVI